MAYIDAYGVRYSDDKKTLEYFPSDFRGKYIIPEGVQRLSTFRDILVFDDGELPPVDIYETYTPFTRLTEQVKHSFYDSMVYRTPIVNCPYLTELEFPKSFTKLPENALKRYKALKTVIFHSEELQIGDNAFYGCENLEQVIIEADNVEFGQDVFYKTPYEKKMPRGRYVLL